jgi:two-component system alkaline phosphatase synthesis response regulator PhoP
MDELAQRVLVADGDADTRRLLAFTLEAQGYQVVVVEDADLVLPQVLRHQPELVVLGPLPLTTDGRDVLTALRVHRTSARLPVILLTDPARRRTRQGWLAAADYELPKPFDFNQLLRCIDNLVAEKRRQAPSWR